MPGRTDHNDINNEYNKHDNGCACVCAYNSKVFNKP
jgi:hypothetical protein